MGKEGSFGDQHFLLLLLCLLSAFFLRVIKTPNCVLTLYHTIPTLYNRFPNKTWFLRVCCTSLENTSNFSFSRSIFYPFGELSSIFIKFKVIVCKLFQFGRVKNLLCGRGLRSLLKTLWEKEKMLVTSIFSFSHNVFYPSLNKFQFFSYIYFVVCKCFQFGPI